MQKIFALPKQFKVKVTFPHSCHYCTHDHQNVVTKNIFCCHGNCIFSIIPMIFMHKVGITVVHTIVINHPSICSNNQTRGIEIQSFQLKYQLFRIWLPWKPKILCIYHMFCYLQLGPIMIQVHTYLEAPTTKSSLEIFKNAILTGF